MSGHHVMEDRPANPTCMPPGPRLRSFASAESTEPSSPARRSPYSSTIQKTLG